MIALKVLLTATIIPGILLFLIQLQYSKERFLRYFHITNLLHALFTLLLLCNLRLRLTSPP